MALEWCLDRSPVVSTTGSDLSTRPHSRLEELGAVDVVCGVERYDNNKKSKTTDIQTCLLNKIFLASKNNVDQTTSL